MTENTTNGKTKSKKTILRRITGIVGYVFIFLIIVLFVFVISFKSNNRTMFIFGKATVRVLTPSMEPTIPANSYILVSKTDPEDIEVGDVIMFRSEDQNIQGSNNTHRVVEIIGDHEEFITKGDNSPGNDPMPTKAENIVGVYVKNLPVLTAISKFLFSGIGMIITVTLIFAIIMAIYLPDIIRKTREKSNELENKRQAKIDELVSAEVERMKREDEAKKETQLQGDAEETPAEEETAEENDASVQETAGQEDKNN